jgi:hypothetical protein
MSGLTVELSHPDLPEAAGLIDALSAHLLRHYGSDGRASFGFWGAAPERSVFVLARSNGIAVACGALRPLDDDRAEVTLPEHGAYAGRPETACLAKPLV